MANDKVLIIVNSGPETPHRCATPFYFASVAAAMDYEVTMYFVSDGLLLLKPGVAETVHAKAGGKPISDFVHDAMAAGVHMLACSASAELHDLGQADLLPGVLLAGAATIWELAEECKTVLTL
jgi:predicted peroxiredoxin